MKKNISLLLALFVSATSIAQLNTYSFKRKVHKVDKPGFYSIHLIPEITAKMKSGLHDVRLFSIDQGDTTEIPYLFEWIGDKKEIVAVPFERINDSYNQKCCSYVTLKFPAKQVINQVKLDVEEAEFDKRVMIEGSNDNKEWFTIKEHMRIVRFRNSAESFSYTNLDFESSEYSYYRLNFDDDGSKKITVSNVYAFQNKEIPGTYSELESKMQIQVENKESKTTELIVELPFNYLISYMTIKGKNTEDFYRNINVYASAGTYTTKNGVAESWYIINSSVLSSKEAQPINFNNEASTKIKIEIINNDNSPVKITEVKVFGEQCRLVAKLPVSESAYITYGKENVSAPTYDLVHFKDKIPAELVDVFYEGEETVLTASVDKGPMMTNKTWLWLVMGIVILVIGYFALNMIRKEQQHTKE
ncbi:MAG: DUF3999 family protein [Bacteroidota bacterium]|nr:DUF3999 family protein [Bacteroidota bacterium]